MMKENLQGKVYFFMNIINHIIMRTTTRTSQHIHSNNYEDLACPVAEMS